MSYSLARVCVLALAAGTLFGCLSAPTNTHHKENEQFADLPVPPGLELVKTPGKSFSMEQDGFRHGQFVYRGDATVERVVAFVQRRMPVQGWDLVEDRSDQLDLQEFRYEKEAESDTKDILDVKVEGQEKLIRLTYVVRRR